MTLDSHTNQNKMFLDEEQALDLTRVLFFL